MKVKLLSNTKTGKETEMESKQILHIKPIEKRINTYYRINCQFLISGDNCWYQRSTQSAGTASIHSGQDGGLHWGLTG